MPGFPLQGLLASSLSLTTGSLSALAGLGDDAGIFQLLRQFNRGIVVVLYSTRMVKSLAWFRANSRRLLLLFLEIFPKT